MKNAMIKTVCTRRKMKKITIKDVAKAAGVSISAVSRVFNGYEDISEETQKKVFAAAEKLEYTPNSAARHLSTKKKKIIALVLNEINVTRGVAMPLEILGGVIDSVDQTDYEFMFIPTDRKKQEKKSLLQLAREYDLSGIIIQGLRTSDPYYEELSGLPLPIVGIDLALDDLNIGSVAVDNYGASIEVTERLIHAGYKKILFVNGSKEAVVSQTREAGYRKGLGQCEPHVLYADYQEQKAFDLIREYPDVAQFDAIYAASDLMAIGIIKALIQRQMINEIAVVGFDDITLASYITPTLSTVRQNISEITKNAVSDVIEQIEEGRVRKRLIPYEIIVRESARF